MRLSVVRCPTVPNGPKRETGKLIAVCLTDKFKKNRSSRFFAEQDAIRGALLDAVICFHLVLYRHSAKGRVQDRPEYGKMYGA